MDCLPWNLFSSAPYSAWQMNICIWVFISLFFIWRMGPSPGITEETRTMRSYRQLPLIMQTMRAGKAGTKGTDHLVSIYERIARKGNKGNS